MTIPSNYIEDLYAKFPIIQWQFFLWILKWCGFEPTNVLHKIFIMLMFAVTFNWIHILCIIEIIISIGDGKKDRCTPYALSPKNQKRDKMVNHSELVIGFLNPQQLIILFDHFFLLILVFIVIFYNVQAKKYLLWEEINTN